MCARHCWRPHRHSPRTPPRAGQHWAHLEGGETGRGVSGLVSLASWLTSCDSGQALGRTSKMGSVAGPALCSQLLTEISKLLSPDIYTSKSRDPADARLLTHLET